MPDLTTAQRLAAYRKELDSEGIPIGLADDLVRDAAHHIHREDDGPTIAADLEDDTTPCVGVTHVRLVPHLDKEAMVQVMHEMHERALQAQQGHHPTFVQDYTNPSLIGRTP